MAVEEIACRVKLVAAAARGDLYFSAARPAILGLVIRREHFEFGYGIDIERDVLGAVRAGIDIRRSVDCQIVLAAAIAVDIETAETAGPGHLPVDRAHRTRNK